MSSHHFPQHHLKNKVSLFLILLCTVIFFSTAEYAIALHSDYVSASFIIKTFIKKWDIITQKITAPSTSYDLMKDTITPLTFTMQNQSTAGIYYAVFFDFAWDTSGTDLKEAKTFYVFNSTLTDAQVKTNADSSGNSSLCPPGVIDTVSLNMTNGIRTGATCNIQAVSTIAAGSSQVFNYKLWLNHKNFNAKVYAEYKGYPIELKIRVVAYSDAAGTIPIPDMTLTRTFILKTDISVYATGYALPLDQLESTPLNLSESIIYDKEFGNFTEGQR